MAGEKEQQDGQQADTDKEFEDAFAEFAGGRDQTGDDDPPADGGEADDGKKASGKNDDDPPDIGSAADGKTKEPSDEDGSKGKSEPSGKKPDETDIWANASLTPEQKAALDQLRHENQSLRGRQSALDRREQELLRRERQLSGALQPSQQRDGGKAKPKSVLDDPDLQKAKEEYPEVFGPVEKVIKALEDRVGKADAILQNLDQERTEAYLEAQEELLVKKHPDWATVAASQEFGQWLAKQPRAIQEAAIRNGDGIVDAQEAGLVIDLYKQQTQKTENPPDNGAGNGGGKGTSTTDTRRKRQLEGAAAVISKGAGGGAAPPDDFEQAFNYYASKQKRA